MDQGQLLQAFIALVAGIVAAGLLFFLPAGTFAWPAAWAAIGTLVLGLVGTLVALWRADPAALAARSTGFKSGTKKWDYWIAGAMLVAMVLVAPAAGLEFRASGRSLPVPVMAIGHLLLIASIGLIAWAQVANPFFEPGVRIQTERGHKVVEAGPYAHIRHPGYLGGSLFALGLALALGSLAALGPAFVAIGLLAYRTVREDETLIAELPGYAGYTGRVRARWVPRLW